MRLREYARDNWLLAAVVVAALVLVFIEPQRVGRGVVAGLLVSAKFAILLIPIFVFVGLLGEWVKQDVIVENLGSPGLKPLLLGGLFGTVFSGPLPSLFPIMKGLLERRARPAVVIAIASAFAIKLPMIPLELKLLGWRFTLIHNALLFVLALPIAVVMERLLRIRPDGRSTAAK